MRLACIVLIVCLDACAPYHYEAKPVETAQAARDYAARSLDDPALRDFLAARQYPLPQWPLPDWGLQPLTLAAWYFHPDLQVAIAEYQKARVHEETVNARINPGVQIPLEHHSDTSGDKSPWLIGILFKLVFEREGKRQARRDQAVAETGAADIRIHAVAWNIYGQLRQKYLEYYSTVKQDEQLTVQADIVGETLKLLMRRKDLGQASAFEISATQIEIQRIRLQQAGQKFTKVDALHALAGAMGIPGAALEHAALGFADLEVPNTIGDLPEDELRELALTHRTDIRRSLAEYNIDEATLRLEIEKQYPDITLTPGFVFDQDDLIWALGTSWVLPLLQPQNEGPIREALAQREIKQKEFLALQARVSNDVGAAHARLAAQSTALQEAEKLLQETMTRNQQMRKQYDLGYADLLELNRSRIEVAGAEQAVSNLRISVLKAAGQLEDAIQYPLFIHATYHFQDTQR